MSEFDPEFTARLERLREEEQVHARQEHEENERILQREREQQVATEESLRLGERYAAMIRAAGIQPVDVYDYRPVGPVRMERQFGKGWIGDRRPVRNSHLEAIDKGWVVRLASGADLEGGRWSIENGVMLDGQILTNFKTEARGYRGFDNEYPNGIRGIISPRREIGGSALKIATSESFMDGVVWVAAGNGPLRR